MPSMAGCCMQAKAAVMRGSVHDDSAAGLAVVGLVVWSVGLYLLAGGSWMLGGGVMLAGGLCVVIAASRGWSEFWEGVGNWIYFCR
jgi:hypothetical protein